MKWKSEMCLGWVTVFCGLVMMGKTVNAQEATFERLTFEMPMRCDVAVPADIDADGDLDIVGVCRTKVMGVQMPEGTVHELYDARDGAMIHAISLDRDDDGDRDVAIARFQNPWLRDNAELTAKGENWTIGWLENAGKIGTWPLHIVDAKVNGSHGIAAGDLDGDGVADLVSANVSGPHFPKSVTWWPGSTGERRFVVEKDAGGRPHYVATGDLNGDERQDVALGAGGGWSVHLRTDDGWDHQPVANTGGGTNVTLGDVDGDGALDVIGSAGHGTGVFWFANPDWTRHVIDGELADVHSLTSGDLDADGDTDVVANSNKSNVTKIYWNDGQGRFQSQTIDEGNGQQSYGCTLVDLDADGRLDILLGGRGSNNVVWYRQMN